jgi:hypothetical protein
VTIVAQLDLDVVGVGDDVVEPGRVLVRPAYEAKT